MLKLQIKSKNQEDYNIAPLKENNIEQLVYIISIGIDD